MKHDICPTCGQEIQQTQTDETEVLSKTQLKVKTAREVFQFWQVLLNKTKSNANTAILNKINRRIKEGYSELQIIQAIFGLSLSDFHIENKFTHIDYVVRPTANIDRFIEIAENNKITETEAKVKFNFVISKLEQGLSIDDLIEPCKEFKPLLNEKTGIELK